MLTIHIPSKSVFNEETNEFIDFKGQTIQLEHSLVSVSKWESKYQKPFMTKENKTKDETLYYIKCMTITQNVSELAYLCMSRENIMEINKYIESPMTATTFYDPDGTNNYSREIITSELVYYWMISLNIPMECQRWHFNRLLTLIRVCNIKNNPQKKMSNNDIMKRNKALNDARRKKLNTRG